MATIKETLDVLNTLEATANGIKDALADGKIEFSDLTKLLPVLLTLKDALQGASEIPAELKDLDSEEIKTLFEKLIAIITLIVEIIKGAVTK